MSDILGNVIVLAVLTIVVALAVRSLWKTHKESGHCSCNCGNCSGCQGNCHSK